MAASSGSGGASSAPPTLGGTELGGERSCLFAAGEDVHPGALGHGDLGGEVGGAAEAVDAQTAAVRQPGAPKGAVADDPGTQQRGGLLVAEDVGSG